MDAGHSVRRGAGQRRGRRGVACGRGFRPRPGRHRQPEANGCDRGKKAGPAELLDVLHRPQGRPVQQRRRARPLGPRDARLVAPAKLAARPAGRVDGAARAVLGGGRGLLPRVRPGGPAALGGLRALRQRRGTFGRVRGSPSRDEAARAALCAALAGRRRVPQAARRARRPSCRVAMVRVAPGTAAGRGRRSIGRRRAPRRGGGDPGRRPGDSAAGPVHGDGPARLGVQEHALLSAAGGGGDSRGGAAARRTLPRAEPRASFSEHGVPCFVPQGRAVGAFERVGPSGKAAGARLRRDPGPVGRGAADRRADHARRPRRVSGRAFVASAQRHALATGRGKSLGEEPGERRDGRPGGRESRRVRRSPIGARRRRPGTGDVALGARGLRDPGGRRSRRASRNTPRRAFAAAIGAAARGRSRAGRRPPSS